MGRNCNCLLKGQTEVRFEGDLGAQIVFVLESPGENELIEGRPAVGEAGQRWEREINNIGIFREHVFIINSARCRIDKKTLSDSNIKKILKSCRTALETTIHHINPKIIVACGGIAAHSVMGVPILGIKKRRGTFAYSEEFGCDVLYTIHPSATLRNEGDLPRYQQDMRLLRKYIDNGFTIPAEETNYREVDSIQFMLDKKDFTVGIDTETQGLRWFDPNHFTLISYSISEEAGTGYNVILWEEVLPIGDEIPPHDRYIVYERGKEEIPVFLRKADNYDIKMAELSELLTREDIKKYTKNGIGYDCHVFEGADLPSMVNHAMDTQLSSHALDSELYLNNTLDFLMQSFTTMPAFKQEFSSTYDKADMLFSLRENRQAFTDYACGDADATLRVGLAIREKMIEDPTTANYYMKFVHKASASVLYGISKNGIKIDQARIQSAEVEVLEELEVCEHECIKRIPQAVKDRHIGNLNLNRRRLIADALFSKDGFGLTATAFTTKTGEPQISKDVLKQLKSRCNRNVRDFLEWRENREELHTIYTHYIKSLQGFIASDGKIHTSMSISFTSSGRAGSRKPNTMVFPSRNKKQAKIVKSLFVPPEGYKFLNLDLSQAELRFIAHISQDTRMMEAFYNDEDLHLLTAIDLVSRSGIVWDTISEADKKDARQKAKPVNFGLPYGMSPNGLRDYALNDYGIKLSRKEAQVMWNAWHNLYPGIREWHDKCREEMYRDGKVRTLMGRNRWLPNLYSSSERQRKDAERIGINVKIQGPSSDYTLLGGYYMYRDGLIDTEEIMINNFVHDSLLFAIQEDKVMDYAVILKQRMENVDTSDFEFELSVPMKVDIQVGDNLASLEEIEL